MPRRMLAALLLGVLMSAPSAHAAPTAPSSVVLDHGSRDVCPQGPHGEMRSCPARDPKDPYLWTGQVVDSKRGHLLEVLQSRVEVLGPDLAVLAKIRGFQQLHSPALLGDTLYAIDGAPGSQGESLVAIDLLQNRLSWRAPVPHTWDVNDSLVAAGGTVWLGGCSAVYRVDTARRTLVPLPHLTGLYCELFAPDPSNANAFFVLSGPTLWAQVQVANGKPSVTREFPHDDAFYNLTPVISPNGATAAVMGPTGWVMTDSASFSQRLTPYAPTLPNLRIESAGLQTVVVGWSDIGPYPSRNPSVAVWLEGLSSPALSVQLPSTSYAVKAVDVVPGTDKVAVVHQDAGGPRAFVVTTFTVSGLLPV